MNGTRYVKRILDTTVVASLWAIAWSLASLRAEAGVGKLLKEWRAPIEFYGKVVDENSNPVAGAQITFRWMEVPDNSGSRSSKTVSDAKGMFSLHGAKGPSVSVWFSKDGYYSSHHGQRGFNYALGPDPISPDPKNPVIFVLKRKGASPPSLVSMKQNYRISRDGTPVAIDLATGTKTSGENGNFVVRCWTKDQGIRSGQKFDWRCTVTIPGGGIVATDEEFPFLAPVNGYKPSIEINMSTNGPIRWQDDVDLKFYYRLADGRYGRMTFSMIAGGDNFCMINSVLNPTGSRNLEPAQ